MMIVPHVIMIGAFKSSYFFYTFHINVFSKFNASANSVTKSTCDCVSGADIQADRP